MLFHFACEAMGAAGTRLSLRPLFFERRNYMHHSGAIRAAGRRSCVHRVGWAKRKRAPPFEAACCNGGHGASAPLPTLRSWLLVVARLDRAIQYSRDASERTEKPQRTGYPAGACHRARQRRDQVAGYDRCEVRVKRSTSEKKAPGFIRILLKFLRRPSPKI
jgi:hypothetical protein